MDEDVLLSMVSQLFEGTWITLLLLSQSTLYGLILAIPIALARISHVLWIWVPAYGYIFCLRGSPLLVQLFLIYYGLGQFESVRSSVLWVVLYDAYWCAVIALTLNTSGYIAEILRGAIQSVPQGTIDAGKACGMGIFLLHLRIILPQACRIALPAYTNEIIFLMNGSALVFTITVVDLMGAVTMIRAQTFLIYQPLLMAGMIYLMITVVITLGMSWLERVLYPER